MREPAAVGKATLNGMTQSFPMFCFALFDVAVFFKDQIYRYSVQAAFSNETI